MNELFFHIGYYKTGTSYLQRYIFPQLKGIDYRTNVSFEDILTGKFISTKKTIVSINALSGMPFTKNRPIDKYEILMRLSKHYPEATIIVVRRQTKDWVKSCYNEFVKQGGIHSFRHWFNDIFDLDYINGNYEKGIQALFANVVVLDYWRFKYYQECFYNTLCSVLNIENNIAIPNIVVNKSYKNYQLNILKLINLAAIFLPIKTGKYNFYRKWKGK